MNTIFIQRVNLPLYRLIVKLTEGSCIGRGCFWLNKCVQTQKILCLTLRIEESWQEFELSKKPKDSALSEFIAECAK